jgi:hypothetical protein
MCISTTTNLKNCVVRKVKEADAVEGGDAGGI